MPRLCASGHLRSRARREARDLVQFLFGKELARDQVLDTIGHHPAISEAVRRESLALAKDWLPDVEVDAHQLNDASWAVVRRPDAKPDEYKRALHQAETACRVVPGSWEYLTSLGVAQYRVGRFPEALATLTRSDETYSKVAKRSRPADLAFLAMTQYQLGKKAEAQATLVRLQEAMKDPSFAKDEEAQGFLREAEGCLPRKGAPPPAPELKPEP